MSKIINFFKKNVFVLIVLLASIPTFWRILQPGIYSTQDFHLFRLYEFDKCIKILQIPCRWAPDGGLGYGEPLFNFYGQFSYAVGEIFHLIGFSFIDSFKILFILSLVGSGVSMFFLAGKIWKNNFSALVSSVTYMYAPYRAVDVWVRGALPEAFSFILFPLILLSIENKKLKTFSLLFAALILTHNLSALMFLPITIVWIIYRKFWKGVLGGLVAGLTSAFYILPVVFESRFIDLGSTIIGYFDYRAHFVTLYQLLVSRFWGYGASTWGSNDGLSLSVGLVQWILPAVLFLVFMYRYIKTKNRDFLIPNSSFLILFVMGCFYLFLTHNKSTFIWNLIPQMAYIQFPWRFLGMVTFCFALASGIVVRFFEKQKSLIALLIISVVFFLNFSFFREDIWYKVSDSYFFTGAEWDRQRIASIGDFWPNFGHKIPNKPSDGRYINYFPGWKSNVPAKDGLIPSAGSVFTDTPVRRIGNIISLLILLGFFVAVLKRYKWEKET